MCWPRSHQQVAHHIRTTLARPSRYSMADDHAYVNILEVVAKVIQQRCCTINSATSIGWCK